MNSSHGIIEAGTGTGKSFAYLLPALLWAYENQCRVLVSTNTIALQEQLYQKDIPFSQAMSGLRFSSGIEQRPQQLYLYAPLSAISQSGGHSELE